MNSVATREHLLDAAERLFAEHGFEGASLRSITAAAGANLASVHYHFGSKESLIRAVFSRRIQPLNHERLRLLDAAQSAADDTVPPLESIVEAFVAPALRLREDFARGGRHFVCLMGRLWAEPTELTASIMEEFDEVFRRFTVAVGRALPDLPQPDLHWRFLFMIGTMLMPMMVNEVITRRTHGQIDPGDPDGNIRRLVAFISAGLRAPVLVEPGGIR